MGIDTKKVVHISFIVRDIQKTVGNWRLLLGLSEMPRIWNIPKPEQAPAMTNGIIEDYSDCQLSVINLENIMLEFVQPGQGSNPWKTWLDAHGEGIQHISFQVDDREKTKEFLTSTFPVADWYHVGYYPGSTYAFYDLKDELGCEINIKSNDDNTACIQTLLQQYINEKENRT